METAQDVLEELPVHTALTATTTTPAAPPSVAANDDPLLAAMGWDPIGLDALLARTGYDTATLQVRLLEQELDGQLARLPGGLFQRLALS